MAGLLKPYAAAELVSELKKAVDLPIHLHTHDTSSIQPATYLKAIEAGVDVVDVALASMSGLTSQPNFNSVAAFMKGHEREQPINLRSLNEYSTYFEDVREYYYPFESGLKAGTAEVYEHEIPGGQYSNLRPQAAALGLEEKFEEVKKNYAVVNDMFGHIVKVTPSSKVVGDMAIFMTSNNLTEKDIYERGQSLSFPESVVNLMKGDLGQAPGGFPAELQKVILKGQKAFHDRPNAHLEPVDFDKDFADFKDKFKDVNFLDFLSYKLYPKVFEDFHKVRQEYGTLMHLPTTAFFYGLKNNEDILVEIDEGKNIIIKLLFISEPNENGQRLVSFELNGQTRRVWVRDDSLVATKPMHRKAEAEGEVGAPLQGRIAQVLVKEGDTVKENQSLFVIEAMKMETTISAPFGGKVNKVLLTGGTMVSQDDLVVIIEK